MDFCLRSIIWQRSNTSDEQLCDIKTLLYQLVAQTDTLNSKRRAYNATRIKMSELSRAQYSQLIEENREVYAYSSDSLSVAQPFELVKEYGSIFFQKMRTKR